MKLGKFISRTVKLKADLIPRFIDHLIASLLLLDSRRVFLLI